MVPPHDKQNLKGYGPTVKGIIKKIGHFIDNAASVRLMMPFNVWYE
jgi:hypothetical protein